MSEENKGNTIKVALLGDSGVGKSSIVLRYTSNEFNDNYLTTNVAAYTCKIIEKYGEKYQLDIWDTAGQEKFRAIGKNFYKDAYIVFLVYDITLVKSFEDLKEIWYNELMNNGEKDPIIVIVGNKCDLYDEDEAVNEDDARKYAKEINALFHLVSAKNGLGIEKLFNDTLEFYLKNNYPEKIKKINQERTSVKLDKKEHNDNENENVNENENENGGQKEGGNKPSGKSKKKKKKNCC